MRKYGFTLIEVLISIAILALLAMAVLFSTSRQRSKAENVRIKSDLANLKIAFEDYYNDHNCYPPVEWFNDSADCNSAQFSPYLKNIPCDPHTGKPYSVETDITTCQWYKIYGMLDNPTADPDSLSQYNDNGSTLGNYGVSSTNTFVTVYFNKNISSSTPAPTSIPTSTPLSTPASTPTPTYYCQSIGNCSSIPYGAVCTPSYISPNCDGGANKCSTISTCN